MTYNYHRSYWQSLWRAFFWEGLFLYVVSMYPFLFGKVLIYMCVCVCVCLFSTEREREREREREVDSGIYKFLFIFRRYIGGWSTVGYSQERHWDVWKIYGTIKMLLFRLQVSKSFIKLFIVRCFNHLVKNSMQTWIVHLLPELI